MDSRLRGNDDAWIPAFTGLKLREFPLAGVTGDAVNRMLTPLAAGYGLGTTLRVAAYRRGWLKTRRLNCPVVSVGNLSVGGTGKTPFVAYLAEWMMQCGWRPCILTRGYGRRRGQNIVVVEPGANRSPDPRQVGDEPAWLARKLPNVPLVVGADRYLAGCMAEEKFNADMFILDDGFQHLALERDVDIVLVDATQELSDRMLLPTGRLREPLAALRRADLVMITRCELASALPVEDQVRGINPHAEVFRSATALHGLRDIANSTLRPVEAFRNSSFHAFCGIGTPEAFFGDLVKWGFNVTAKTAFPDHHVYLADEMARLVAQARAAGAQALVTTEKDTFNIPNVERDDLPIMACVIQAEVCDMERFEAALGVRLETARAIT